jgi:nicotinamide-nucleotide amidase
MSITETAKELVALLTDAGITLATAESCTGGLIASSVVSIPGASSVFLEGCVTYSNEAKARRLGVREETLARYGAVSEETVREMARGIAATSGADCGIATTGIAGPDGATETKPVGLVWIAVSYRGHTEVMRLLAHGSRNEVREKAAVCAMRLMIDYVNLV